jgi:hypothetical protein
VRIARSRIEGGKRRFDSDLRDARGSVARAGLFAILIVVVLVFAAIGIALSMTPSEVTQPLLFNHNLHVEDVGLECPDCHLLVTSSERTIIPNIQQCAECHFDAITDSATEARLIEYIEAGEPIPWRQVYSVPDHVYFSHRRHTAAAEIDCQTCHGAVPERVVPLGRPLVPISMGGCIDCHDRSGVSNDCISCHR